MESRNTREEIILPPRGRKAKGVGQVKRGTKNPQKLPGLVQKGVNCRERGGGTFESCRKK